MENHREALLEHDGAGRFSLELACCQSRVFGKLGPNAPGHFTPAAADGFHDHKDKRDALRLALDASVVVTALEVLLPLRDAAGIGHRISGQVGAEPRSDGEVPGGGWA